MLSHPIAGRGQFRATFSTSIFSSVGEFGFKRGKKGEEKPKREEEEEEEEEHLKNFNFGFDLRILSVKGFWLWGGDLNRGIFILI
ncbi:hypothetical protein SDJN03_05380, partial [Cucurbita argyrosperma subsp. sororia]